MVEIYEHPWIITNMNSTATDFQPN